MRERRAAFAINLPQPFLLATILSGVLLTVTVPALSEGSAGMLEYLICRDRGAGSDYRIFACSRLLAEPGQPKDIVAEVLVYRGDAYFERKSCSSAIADYSTALLLKENDPEALFKRGVCYYEANDYNNAIKDASRAIELKSHDYEFYNLRGNAHRKRKSRNEAITDFRRSLMIAPGNRTAWCALEGLGVAAPEGSKPAEGLKCDAETRADRQAR